MNNIPIKHTFIKTHNGENITTNTIQTYDIQPYNFGSLFSNVEKHIKKN